MANDRKNKKRSPEKEAVRTTIVGGRPPGAGKSIGNIPRGIEILVKKASVDPEFKKMLLKKRSEAAREIELVLNPAETAMINSVTASHLMSIINNTKINPKQQSAFLGKVAAVMIAALGIGFASCNGDDDDANYPIHKVSFGITPYIDMDNDGIDDSWEEEYFDSINKCKPEEDPDSDDLTNIEEYIRETNPITPDTDDDGYNDGEEVDNDSDPLDPASTP